MAEIRHGTASAYSWHKCRCDVCKAYKSASSSDHRARMSGQINAKRKARYEANRDGILAERKAKRAARTEIEKEKQRESNRRYLSDPEARRKRAARTARYQRTDLGKEAQRRGKQKRRGVEFTAEAKDYIEILKHDPCVYCGGPGPEIDHIVPVTAGGCGEWDNLAPACRDCNNRKTNKPLLSFLLSRQVA